MGQQAFLWTRVMARVYDEEICYAWTLPDADRCVSVAIQGKTAEVLQPFKGKHHNDREGQHDPELADLELSLVMNKSKESNTVFTKELFAQFPASGHMRGKHVLWTIIWQTKSRKGSLTLFA